MHIHTYDTGNLDQRWHDGPAVILVAPLRLYCTCGAFIEVKARVAVALPRATPQDHQSGGTTFFDRLGIECNPVRADMPGADLWARFPKVQVPLKSANVLRALFGSWRRFLPVHAETASDSVTGRSRASAEGTPAP